MIRTLLTRLGWPDFRKPDRLAVIEAKAQARLGAAIQRRDARRKRQADATYRAHVNATAAQLASEIGREWPA